MDADLVTAALLLGGLYMWRTNRLEHAGTGGATPEVPNGQPEMKSHAHSGEQPTTQEPHISEEDGMISDLKSLIARNTYDGNIQNFLPDEYTGRKTPLGLH